MVEIIQAIGQYIVVPLCIAAVAVYLISQV
jgi:hypothetical protein